jgi:hypothetical protein
MKIAITTLLGILFIVKAVAQPSFIEKQKK